VLVQMAQRGDRAAFARLHGEFARIVHGIALANGPGGAAEDVTQDVFMTAFEQLPALRDPAAFPAWLCTAARNAAVSALRRSRRQRAEELSDLADPAARPDDRAAAVDGAERVLACIRELPPAYRETLVLRLCEGLGGAQIAARTGLTHGSVRVNLSRGMALLRPLLRERGLP
jgi:RNA polymerase sigma-70 factor, ECF subfamily